MTPDETTAAPAIEGRGRRERLTEGRQKLLSAWLSASSRATGEVHGEPSSTPASGPFSVTLDPATLRPLMRLPNGLAMAFQSATETRHLYDDLFADDCYFRFGVELGPDAVVFDVGANIGMFVARVSVACPTARVFAFEPAPPLFEILTFNAGRLAPSARLFPYGLGRERLHASLTFYPHSSGMSTFHPDLTEEKDVLRAIIRNQVEEGAAPPPALLQSEEELLDQRFASRVFDCDIERLSDVIVREGVERIDLLKIDVQKSEAAVLAGIDAIHWPRIDQIVAEVHDLDGRLQDVVALLRAQRFIVDVAQQHGVRGSVLYNVFARRDGAALPHQPAV